MCPLQGCTDGVRLGLFLALLAVPHSKFPSGKGALAGVRSSMGPGPLAFRAKTDLSKLYYCAGALHHLGLPQKGCCCCSPCSCYWRALVNLAQ